MTSSLSSVRERLAPEDEDEVVLAAAFDRPEFDDDDALPAFFADGVVSMAVEAADGDEVVANVLLWSS